MYIDETKWGTYTSLNRDQVTVAKYLIPVQQDDKTCNAHINVKFRSVRLTTVTVEKAIIITYSQCVSLALVIQHAERMCPIILSFVTCLVHTYVSTLSHKGYDFLLKKKLLNIKCASWFSLQLLSETFSFWEELSDMITNIHGSSYEVPVILVRF